MGCNTTPVFSSGTTFVHLFWELGRALVAIAVVEKWPAGLKEE